MRIRIEATEGDEELAVLSSAEIGSLPVVVRRGLKAGESVELDFPCGGQMPSVLVCLDGDAVSLDDGEAMEVVP